MPFDENGNYVLSGNPADRMSMAGTGGMGYAPNGGYNGSPSRLRSFLNYFQGQQQPQQSQIPFSMSPMQMPYGGGGQDPNQGLFQGHSGARALMGKFVSFLGGGGK